jgi:cytochrome b involved in lipid metabolism
MEDVKKANTRAKCWSAIDGNVYDLTSWISSHPGGTSAILFLCGKDGTSSFKAQHEGASSPASVLANYSLGPLAP